MAHDLAVVDSQDGPVERGVGDERKHGVRAALQPLLARLSVGAHVERALLGVREHERDHRDRALVRRVLEHAELPARCVGAVSVGHARDRAKLERFRDVLRGGGGRAGKKALRRAARGGRRTPRKGRVIRARPHGQPREDGGPRSPKTRRGEGPQPQGAHAQGTHAQGARHARAPARCALSRSRGRSER